MVITNLQEKQNRKLWVPIRGGNRGGWSLFNWQDVRQMPYKDRQMYLGNSVTIGVLDKGGKWRKRDWYLKTDKKYQVNNLTSEQSEAMRRDYERMNAALGIQANDDQQKLTEHQMRQLMKKIKAKKQDYQGPQIPDAIGLGFDKMKVQIRSKPSAKVQNPHRLQAMGDIIKQQQKQKKQKKEKKQKKQKKQKKEKREKKKKDRQHKEKNSMKQEQYDREKIKKGKKDKHKKKQRQNSQKKRDRSRSRSHQKRKRRYSSSESNSSNSD